MKETVGELPALLEGVRNDRQAVAGPVRLANMTPLNQATARFLTGGASAKEIAVLTLMRLALDDGITLRELAPGHPHSEQMVSQINSMTRWMPQETAGFLANPESLDEESELVAALADEVDAAETAEDAALVLLEHLYNALVATAP